MLKIVTNSNVHFHTFVFYVKIFGRQNLKLYIDKKKRILKKNVDTLFLKNNCKL